MDEVNAEFEDEYVFAPDPDDLTIGEGLKEAWRRDEEQEYWKGEEWFMCRNILAKIILTCDPSTLTKVKLDWQEKEFMVEYDFHRLRYRDPSKFWLNE